MKTQPEWEEIAGEAAGQIADALKSPMPVQAVTQVILSAIQKAHEKDLELPGGVEVNTREGQKELLPCPFCGGEADTLDCPNPKGGRNLSVFCANVDDCGTEINEALGSGATYSMSELIARWNQRAPSVPTATANQPTPPISETQPVEASVEKFYVGQVISFQHGPNPANTFAFKVLKLGADGKPSKTQWLWPASSPSVTPPSSVLPAATVEGEKWEVEEWNDCGFGAYRLKNNRGYSIDLGIATKEKAESITNAVNASLLLNRWVTNQIEQQLYCSCATKFKSSPLSAHN